MENGTRRCVDCAADISHRAKNARRCEPCRDTRRKGGRHGGLLQPRTCEGCGGTYQPRNGSQRWCRSCVWDAASRWRMENYGAGLERYRADLAAGERTSICRTCGEDFTHPFVGGVGRDFCDAHIASEPPAVMPPGRRRPFSVPRACAICTGAYYPTHPQQKYCFDCAGNQSERHRARRYKLSAADIDAMKARFDGLCWICREKQGQCVDHDHDTGKPRGWLCRPCNGALHYVERDGWLDAATAYLKHDDDLGGGISPF